jgi:hypothetical protein
VRCMHLPLPNKLFSLSSVNVFLSLSLSLSPSPSLSPSLHASLSLSHSLSLLTEHHHSNSTSSSRLRHDPTLSSNVLHTKTVFHRPLIASTCNPQINGCRALINMSKGFSSMGVTYSCGALRPVIEAMVEHKVMDERISHLVFSVSARLLTCDLQPQDDDEVQEKGCWAIGALVKANPETKMQAGEWGGCEAVCQALRDYSGHEAMQQVGLWAMGSLSAVSCTGRKFASCSFFS